MFVLQCGTPHILIVSTPSNRSCVLKVVRHGLELGYDAALEPISVDPTPAPSPQCEFQSNSSTGSQDQSASHEEGIEEDEEDADKSYDSRNTSRRSSQQELGDSHDSQATEVQHVEDLEEGSDADTNVPIIYPCYAASNVHAPPA